MDINVTTKNVHSKITFEAINEHVMAVVMLLDLSSDLEAVVQLVEMLLIEEAPNYKLVQTNVIADTRNNKFSDMQKGIFHIDVYYTQKNCFNVTQLSYTIKK